MEGYMEKPPITTKEFYNFNIWYETNDPNFNYLCQQSGVPAHWTSYQVILNGPNKDSIIKPINLYAQKLIPPPKLISIDNNTVRLRQGNHAEFFLLEKDNGEFYNVDRPWIRQYYNTEDQVPYIPDDCFPGTFKLYMPWFIDENVSISIEQVEDSPITIYPKTFNYYKVPKHVNNVEPQFIAFHFKKRGSHMSSNSFGKIKRQSPMFDMVFPATDIMINRIREFYEK